MNHAINIMDVKHEIKMGRWEVVFHRGSILLRDTRSGEAVKIGDLQVHEYHPKPYVVTKADCHYGHKKIAERFGCSVEEMCRVNNITLNDLLVPGMQLKIPMPKEEV